MRALIALVAVLGCAKDREPPPTKPPEFRRPAACDEYARMIAVVKQCTTLAPGVREQLLHAHETMEHAITKLVEAPDTMDTLEKGCAANLAATRDAAGAACQLPAAVVGRAPSTAVDPERPEPLPSEAPLMGDGKDLPPSCLEYRRLLAKLTTCKNMPAQSREALRDAFQALDGALTSVGSAGRASIDGTCKDGVDAIRQVTKSLCDL